MNFLQEYWKPILIALGGVFLGVLLTSFVRYNSNKNLLGNLTRKVKELESKSMLTEEEKEELRYLKGEIYILKFKSKLFGV